MRIATQVFEMADEGSATYVRDPKNQVPAPTTPPGPPPPQQPEEDEDEFEHDEPSKLDNINSMQHDIVQTVPKVETLAGCKQQLDVMEVLLRQNATDWTKIGHSYQDQTASKQYDR